MPDNPILTALSRKRERGEKQKGRGLRVLRAFA
jgi:hypothetical protein